MNPTKYHRKTASEYDDSYRYSRSPVKQEDAGMDRYYPTDRINRSEMESSQSRYYPPRMYNFYVPKPEKGYYEEERRSYGEDYGTGRDSINLDLTEVVHGSHIENNYVPAMSTYTDSNDYPDPMPNYSASGSVRKARSDVFLRQYIPKSSNPYQFENPYDQNSAPPLYNEGELTYAKPLGHSETGLSHHYYMSSSPSIQATSANESRRLGPYRQHNPRSSSNQYSRSSSEALHEEYSYYRDSPQIAMDHHGTSSSASFSTHSKEALVLAHSKEAPASSAAISIDGLEKKLPYVCRDFRNGQCIRGENCKFLHVLDNEGNTDAITQRSGQICRDFLRGQCTRRNCKFIHSIPESITSQHMMINSTAPSFTNTELAVEKSITKKSKPTHRHVYKRREAPESVGEVIIEGVE